MYKYFFIFFISFFFTSINFTTVHADGKYLIKEMTPQVSTALVNRKARYESLRALKDAGVIGENNKGYVEVLKPNDQAQSIADAENKDRQIIYQTIAQQNGLEDALGTIEEVFAQVQYDKAESGEKVQEKDGRWISK